MGFWELLKIELMKVKRGKMIPLLFIAPLLVVASGVANLQNYFSPEYTNAWAAMFIQSAGPFADFPNNPDFQQIRHVICHRRLAHV